MNSKRTGYLSYCLSINSSALDAEKRVEASLLLLLLPHLLQFKSKSNSKTTLDAEKRVEVSLLLLLLQPKSKLYLDVVQGIQEYLSLLLFLLLPLQAKSKSPLHREKFDASVQLETTVSIFVQVKPTCYETVRTGSSAIAKGATRVAMQIGIAV